MAESLRMGVIGCGVMGMRHCEDVMNSDLTELTAVADINKEAAEAAASRGNAEKTYFDADSLINDDEIEAVIIAMPTAVRTELALEALSAGKHVLLEKPVAMNAGEVEKMMRARGELTVGCFSSRYRFGEPARAAADFLAGDALGDIRIVRVRAIMADTGPRSTEPPPWRLKKSLNGGGILVNWGCYDLDYVLGVTGWKLEPEEVLSQMWQVPPDLASRAAPGSDAETHFCAFIRCAGDTAISFERGEFMPAEAETAWQISGSQGTLNLQMTPGEGTEIVFYKGVSEGPVEKEVIWSGEDKPGSMSFFVTEDFARAVKTGGKPSTGLEESMVVQKITDAIYESAENRTAVKII
jgi:predicted dehydrogenase